MILFYLGLVWLAGIALADAVRLPWWGWLAGAALPLAGVILLRQRPTGRMVCVGILLLALGAARYTVSIPKLTETDVALYNDQGKVSLQGMIASAPEVQDTGVTMRVEVRSLDRADGTSQPVQGLVQVRTVSAQPYRYGDVVTVTGYLATPPASSEGFSYRDYLARRGVYSLINYGQIRVSGGREGSPILAALFDFRADAYQKIDRLLPEPEASLLQGILLGLEQGISPRVRDDFNAVSASHIIAISGMNIAIVAGLLMSMFRRLMHENLALALTTVGVILYSLFVGADPAVVRAAIMSLLALFAGRLGRQTYGPASLGFSALAMTALQPNTLWDVGFQLSFLATCGLVFFTDPLQNRLSAWLSRFMSEGRVNQVVGLVSESLVVTVAAQITTTPLIILVFKRFSLVSLVPNFLIIPVQGQVMVWGILSVALAYIVWPLAQALAWVVWLFLWWTVTIVRLFASLPFASVSLENVSPVLIGGIYAVMFLMTVAMQQPEEQRGKWWAALRQSIGVKAVAGAGLIAAVVVGLAANSLPDGRLHTRFINTDSASAVLITTPSGRHILVDAGGSGHTLSAALGDAMPFWSRSLDVVVLTQPGKTYAGALPDALSRYTVETLITNGTPGGQLETSIEGVVRSQNGNIITAQAGNQIAVGDGVTLTVIGSRAGSSEGDDPGDPVSLLVAYGDIRILLPGDPSADSAPARLAQNAPGSILFIADPGNPALASPEFLSAVGPPIIITGAAANTAPDVFSALTATGAALYRLDQAAVITLSTDGKQVSVTTQK